MALEDYIHHLLASYIASPQWVKSTIGGIYSALPATWRRGAAYGHYCNVLTACDGSQIEEYSRKRLAETLYHAVTTVPAYRGIANPNECLHAPEAVLAKMPFLTKAKIKSDINAYLSESMPARERFKTFTGGSTAEPMMFYLHKGVSRSREYAFMDDFHARIGLKKNDIVLALRGRTVPTADKPGGSLWMYEPIKRHLILSSDHLERDFMVEYMRALRKWKPSFIEAFPSAIYPLARWLLEHPAPEITDRILGILLYSENVYGYQVELLKQVFSCPVLKHYGHSERVLMAASMVDDDRFFFWPQYGHMELVDENGFTISKPNVLGEVVGTSFDNKIMPFIRYRTGDMAMWSEHPGHPSLSGYPVVDRIEGRLQEFLVCKDYRLISICTMGAAHFDALANSESIQYEQFEPGHFLLKVVSHKPLNALERHKIQNAVAEKTQHGCTVEVQQVKYIPRTPRGKHIMLVQHLDLSEFLSGPILNEA